MDEDGVDIGHGVTIRYAGWSPDRDLNPQYDGIPDIERHVVLVAHTTPDGRPCMSGATLDSETARRFESPDSLWTVVSWEPLTLWPSLLCRMCGHHGFIRDGRWVPA